MMAVIDRKLKGRSFPTAHNSELEEKDVPQMQHGASQGDSVWRDSWKAQENFGKKIKGKKKPCNGPSLQFVKKAF